MQIFLDGRLITDALELEEIDTLLSACSIDDGLTVLINQSATVIDCSFHHSEDCLLFVAEHYKLNESAELCVYNFSHIEDCNFKDYAVTEKHMYSDHAEFMKHVSNCYDCMFA